MDDPSTEGTAASVAHRRLPSGLGRRYLVGFDTEELTQFSSDVLVIGSGMAGLTAALGAAARGLTVNLVTKGEVTDTNTWYAQGGIAGAVGEADSVELHLADTLVVGAGLCDEDTVRAVVGEAGVALRDLVALGVDFDHEANGAIDLHREGGHSLPRVLHSGDATGAEIQNTLSARVRNAERVTLFENRFLVDLLTAGDRCVGALVHDPTARRLSVFWADSVVLATGGAGQLYRVTTNPSVATGDGVAAAWRAGAELADLEFVQFHPTAFDSAATPKFLITEALRGEGAYLLDCEENRFMLGVHPLAELAPRDVVSREIVKVMQRCGRPNVWLDARHLGEPLLKARFPMIFETCLEAGYDLSRDLIPVAPAAHYAIGGIRVDIDGRTSVPGLYASGECACSGLHGANRLASNSLLEGLVLSLSIRNNMLLAMRGLGRLLDSRLPYPVSVRELAASVDLRATSLDQEVRFVSGGNQQKVVLSKWLATRSRVFIFDEPTRGIDVGSKVEIYRLIDSMAHEGMGVLVMSTELPEIMGIADRIVVMYEGRITGEFTRAEATQERIIAAAAGMTGNGRPEEAVAA